MKTLRVLGTLLIVWMATICCAADHAAPKSRKLADQIFRTSGVQGGLVVHLNCGDGTLTAALRAGDAYLVHGLAATPRDLDTARAFMQTEHLYGPVSVDLRSGTTLPYIDNTVNLLVISRPATVERSEMLRVLAPRGVAVTLDALGAIVDTVHKPWPKNIGQWTHYMHDATNNAVAHDTAIGPPRHLQWDGSPRYARHHEFTSSVTAVVSARGRLFSIMDMGSRASIQMPSKWRLTARDAFNGIVLWQRPIPSWFNHLWPLKDGPAEPPRRLVAVGDSVYVTLGFDAPVTRLDAATGEIQHTYAGTEGTEEILCTDGQLLVLRDDQPMNPTKYRQKLMICWDEKNRTMKDSEGFMLTPQPRHIVALDATSGQIAWKVDAPVETLTLTADDQNVYFHDWQRIICLDRETGAKKWQSEPLAPRTSMGYVYGPTLVAYGDVVLFADGRQIRKMYAVSKRDGHLLWQAPHYAAGHAGSPEDLMVIDGLVWCGKIAGGRTSGVFTGRDPNTGVVKREFTPDIKTYWFHHRCYRSKATDRYFLSSRTGIEFVDVINKTWEAHHWVRGACSYGIVPCNGLIYAPPHPCACYLESKLSGLCAVAPATQRSFPAPTPLQRRWHQGPAFDTPLDTDSAADPTADWPTYRHDFGRSGATSATVSLPLTTQWQITLGGPLTAPVAAGERVYIAAKDAHAIHALNARDGTPLWTFTAGGPIDSPPTLARGRVLFGAADGRVYCLRAKDGALVWRFDAAPSDMRLVSYGRLESVWPVHGSVLVQNDTVYCVAGRSTFLDGGLRLDRLNLATGRPVSENVFYDEKNPQQDVKVLNMPTASTDILSTDGKRIYMLSQAFDLDGNRLQTVDPNSDPVDRATMQLGEGTHLFSPTGFLDDNAWHRSYWLYGRAFSSGCNWWYRAGRYAPAGRMLVFRGERVWGFGREEGLFVWSPVLENHLFCSAAHADESAIARVKQWGKKAGRDAIFNRQFTRQAPLDKRYAPKMYWSESHPPLHVRAMALAGDTLFVAGPPHVVSEDAIFKRPFAPDVQAKIREQDAAYDGQRGALLMAVSASDGKTLAKVELAAPPVWDALAVAGGRLYLVTTDSKVTCIAGQKGVAVDARGR